MAFTAYTPAFVEDISTIPAAALNTWRVDVGRAVDGCGGGSYAPSGVINVLGAGFGSVRLNTLLETQLGGQNVDPVGAVVADTDNQTFAVAAGQVREFTAPTVAQRDHDMDDTGAQIGTWIHFIRPAAGNNAIILHRPGLPAAIVTMPALTWACATVFYDVSGLWRLYSHISCTPGADA